MPRTPPDKPAPRKRKSRPWKARLAYARAWSLAKAKRLAIIGGLLFVFVAAWFLLSLPNIDKLYEPTGKQSVVIQSQDGRIVGSYGDIYGDFITYEEFPQSLIDAVLATEDRNFFHHFGIDPFGLGRAVYTNLRAGQVVQGGSTITQQVAKNVFLTPERTFSRKLRELLLAFKLERRFSKQELLTIYLNRVYLGAGNFGVDAAARRYFDKSARDLSLSESAILAGMLKAPSRFAPIANPEAARGRAEVVLASMVDAGFLKQAQADKAKKDLAQTITRTTKNSAESALYFTDWIMERLPDYIGNANADLVVTSTLLPELQRMGENAIATVLDKEGEKMNVSQAALVAMTPEGAVRALIGGRDYSQSQYNRATQAKRQPGSAFKLFVYLTALEAGMTPSTTVIDQPITLGKWQPKNYDGEYRGEITLKDAVAHSINTVSVQVAERVGLNNIVRMAHRLGITSDVDALPSIALGSTEVTLLELTGAYAHLAAEGMSVEPFGIVRVATTAGKVLYQRGEEEETRALGTGTVHMMNNMLSGVIGYGTGRGAAIGRPAAGKTGTTSDYRDAWFMGYTPDLVAGVWVGNDNNAEMKKVTGGTLPAPIWREFMRNALANVPAHDLPTSAGFFESIMPWNGAAPVQAPQPVQPAEHQPPPPPKQEESGFSLGKNFWNKLFDKNSIEQEYPSQKRNR